MDLENLVRRLEHDSKLTIEWFESDWMKLNQDRCHFPPPGHKHEMICVNIGQTKTWESRKQKPLGIIIDRNLRFDKNVLNQCKKAGRKLSALTKNCTFISLERRRTLMKSFIESQFGYCPLVWMFCGRKSNNRINHLHGRTLRIVYNDNQSSFENLPRKDRSVSIHHRNIRSFATEIYKIKNNLSTYIMSELFEKRNLNYNLRTPTDFSLHSINIVAYALKSLKYFAGKVWSIVPFGIRNAIRLEEFSAKIKSWRPENCSYTVCLTYIHQVGYI